MKQTYIYLVGICEFTGEPMTMTTSVPLNKGELLIQVVNTYGEYTEAEMLKHGKTIQLKRDSDKLVELQKKVG